MPIIQIGTFRLTGAAATAALLALLAGLAALVWRRPPSWHSWPTMAAAVMWVAFTVYWNRAARNTAADRSMESIKSRQTHQLLLNGALLLVFIEVPGLRQPLIPLQPWMAPAGLAVIGCGVLICVWARRRLGRNWSGRVSIKVDHQLIRSGPYRMLRHPIYTGLLLMYAGTALISCEVHGLIAVLLTIFAYWRKIRIEESALLEAFHEDYSQYRRKTWALVPGVY
jgi:protein-S-isoprenylcysteine O-methyltransferase Ste14